MSTTHATMLAFLSAHKVSELPTRDVVSVTSSEPFDEAFMKVVAAGVLSAPLFDEASGKWVGFIDIRDLVSLSLVVYDKVKAAAGTHDSESLLKHVWEHVRHAKDGLTTVHMAKRNPFITIEPGAPLITLVKLLLNLRSTRARRVAVVDPATGKLVNVVSQMNLVQFVAKQLNIVDEHSDKVHFAELKQTVAACGCATFPALTIDEHASAYDAFKKLETSHVGGLAVVNDKGVITGNISARDIKTFAKNPKMSFMALPVKEFLAHLRGEAIDIRAPVMALHTTSPLRRAVFLFAGTRVHRLYVVDSDQSFKPIGVLSLSDAIKALFAGAVAEMAPVE